MLVKDLLTDDDLISLASCTLVFHMLWGVVGGMERMDRASTLCRKLRSDLRWTKTVVLVVLLLLSEILFNLECLCFCHISRTTQSMTRLNSWPIVGRFDSSYFIGWWRWIFLLAIFHFHFSQWIQISTNMKSWLRSSLLLLMKRNLMIELLEQKLRVV